MTQLCFNSLLSDSYAPAKKVAKPKKARCQELCCSRVAVESLCGRQLCQRCFDIDVKKSRN